jgi:hypothetical protein
MEPVIWTENGKAKKAGMTRAGCPDGFKPKDLVPIPWMVALALQADGWTLRSDIIWAKGLSFCPAYSGSCMPESCRDRPTKGHEYLFLLTKRARYFYDREAVVEQWADKRNGRAGGNVENRKYQWREIDGPTITEAPKTSGRNLRTVWAIPTSGYKEAHFATFPPALVEPCIKAGTSERGVCPSCGTPWERVTERTGHVNKREIAHCPNNSPTKTDSTGWAPTTKATDKWQPTCHCYEGRNDWISEFKPTVPATVLDPFAGAGTTLLVADRLGRDGIGIELNSDYVEMSERRIVGDSPMFAQVVTIGD